MDKIKKIKMDMDREVTFGSPLEWREKDLQSCVSYKCLIQNYEKQTSSRKNTMPEQEITFL